MFLRHCVHKASGSRFHAVNTTRRFAFCISNSHCHHHSSLTKNTFRSVASSSSKKLLNPRREMTTTTRTATSAAATTTTPTKDETKNEKRKIRGLIFDMDGTLTVPNLDFNEMMRRLGCKTNNILKEVDETFTDEELNGIISDVSENI